ncbi:LemA family protein [Ideonella sp. DXS22W]|uniref:LemA family protein n=1 Tax=Pseudaquabacterium inlustre TaxID=2984192 RepID=A0ABU9CI31_9BURK
MSEAGLSIAHLPWGWIGLLVVLGLWMLGARNRIVALRGAVSTAWQQVDAVIKARQQAIGALLDAALPLLTAERGAVDAVVGAQIQVATAAEVLRKRPTREEPTAVLARAEIGMSSALARLVALIETHSELRYETEVKAQLRALADQAPRLAFARESFNEAALRYNAAIDQFPTRLLNGLFRFERAGTL